MVSVFALAGTPGCSSASKGESPSAAIAPPTASASPVSTPDTAIECPPAPIDVAIDYELGIDEDGGVRVDVRSNLPDSAELMVSLFSEPQSYLGQDTNTVTGGKANFGPFMDDGKPLEGTYDLSITLPIARNQPPQVQACIGTSGEMLTGPLVARHEITGDNFASVDEAVTINRR